jgi:hypothetical protein
MIELELSDGTLLELDDDTPPDAIKAQAERAEARIKSGAGFGTDAPVTPSGMPSGLPVTPPGLPVGPAPPETWEDTLRRTRQTYTQPLSDMIGRAATSALTWPMDVITQGIGGAQNLTKMAFGLEPNAQMPSFNRGLRDLVGVPQQGPDTTFESRAAENLLSSILGSPRAVTTPGTQPHSLSPEIPQIQSSTPRAMLSGELAGAVAPVIGEDIGREYGGEAGALLGSLVAGTAPAGLNYAANRGVTRFGAKPGDQSARALTALDRAGVSPLPGLTGNESMSRMENTFAAIPLVGSGIRNRQLEARDQFQNRLYETADLVGRNPGPDPMNPSRVSETPDIIGGRMRDAAHIGERNLDAEFNQKYETLKGEVPWTTQVDPVQTRQEARRLQNGWTGEDVEGGQTVGTFMQNNVEPAVRDLMTFSPTGEPTISSGIPFGPALKTRTRMGYNAQGEKNLDSGTAKVLKGGLTEDITNAMMTSPEMVMAFPDPAVRQAMVERLRTYDREYAQEIDDTLSRMAPPTIPAGQPGEGTAIPQGGAAYPTLKDIYSPDTDPKVFTQGSEPGRMAIMQRTAPDQYPRIAGDVITAKSQEPIPFGDLNISPTAMSKWWGSLGQHERAVLVNENPQAFANMENLQETGNLFRQSNMTRNTSGTSPAAATIGGAIGMMTAPISTLASGAMLAAGAGGLTSENMGRYLARDMAERQALLSRRGKNSVLMSADLLAPEEGDTPPPPLQFGLDDLLAQGYDVGSDLITRGYRRATQ